MISFFLTLLTVTAALVVIVALDRRFSCKCGRQKQWYFFIEHEQVWLMCAWAGLQTVTEVISVIAIDWFFAVLGAIFTVYMWRRVWFHEKDKIKRTARALGRVFVNEHGRLVIRPEDGR